MKNLLFLTFLLFCASMLEAQELSTFAGTGVEGLLNGPATEAELDRPEQLALDKEGNIYFCDRGNNAIRRIDTNNIITTFAGTGAAGDQLGNRLSATFDGPTGITIDSAGIIYIVDTQNHKIKKIGPNGEVEFVAGSGAQGSTNGPAASASFIFPTHICADNRNNLYVCGNNDNQIRKIDLVNEVVTTFAGTGAPGSTNGPGSSATFSEPQGITIDKEGNFYVGDRGNNRIRKITPDGVVSTVAGSNTPGHQDGSGSQALFFGPKGVTVDDEGNIYVADRLNYVVRKIDTSGNVSTLAGTPGSTGYLDGLVSERTLIGRAVGVLVDRNGDLLISDWQNDVIRILTDETSSTREVFAPKNKTLVLHPNPTKDLVRLTGELEDNYRVKVFDLNGRLLINQANSTIIDLHTLTSGVYLLQVKGEKYTNIERVVKE